MNVINLKNQNISTPKSDPEKPAQSKEDKPNPEKFFQDNTTNDVLARWEAPEFVEKTRNQGKLIFLGLILAAIIFYAVYTNSPVMAITFILIGVVTYLYSHKTPRQLIFQITNEGIRVANELFEYENITSFWIFYEPDERKEISFQTKSVLNPFVHIPIHDQDPVFIRECLLKFLLEVKQESGIMNTLEKTLDL